MNFDMGAEKADEEDDIRVETVLVTDDVVSSYNIPDRRGIAGDFFVFKVAGAKAATGADLDEVVAKDRKDYFTELDSVIGDGDHGMNLSIGFREVNKNIEEWSYITKEWFKPQDVLKISKAKKVAINCKTLTDDNNYIVEWYYKDEDEKKQAIKNLVKNLRRYAKHEF